MSSARLDGKRVAIMATDGVEQSELAEPQQALHKAGAATFVVAPKRGSIKGYEHDKSTTEFKVDRTIAEAKPEDYDALVLPGGVMNADALRQDAGAVKFVKAFVQAGKPIAAICHAPWLLIEADAVRGKSLTSFPSLKTDLRNAGANWADREVVVDQGLVTSRTPQDLRAFNEKMVEEIAEGVHTAANRDSGALAGATSAAQGRDYGGRAGTKPQAGEQFGSNR
ncbi:MAG TPA: type 1 glutamine amidotransferase domain-containing protein [Gemmatimonadales bacterium]|jgi:protease I